MSYSFCQVVVEDGVGFQVERPVCTLERNEDAVFRLEIEEGYQPIGVDYPNYSLEYSGKGTEMLLTLHQVRYSTVVAVSTQQSGQRITYYANGGERLDGESSEEGISVTVTPAHLRLNTAFGTKLFRREGYTQIGWNTQPDGNGTAVGLGSRIQWEEGLTLYAQWSRWTDEDAFTYQSNGTEAVITGYHGQESVISIPMELDGCTVCSVAEGAFAGVNCETVVCPNTLRELEKGAFQGCTLQELYLYDNISSISDYTFEGCGQLTTLRLNAEEAPVYSGNYFDTFQDKYDRLLSLRDKKKIVLFSGSSARFGYDSAQIDKAFPGYEVVNMGVFAYTNALPQMMLILDCMEEGDILLHSPEFDAAKRQFCTSTSMDAPFFCMMESNYDTLAALDLRQYQQVFSGLYSYLSEKSDMEPGSYALSPSQFDEDGNRVDQPSYNEYGDYIRYRPNAKSDAPVYGLPVEYTVAAFPKDYYLDAINEIYSKFLEKGISVYFTYAPRNRHALSEDSTPEARRELHQYLKNYLVVPVISDVEDSLWPGEYLFGTDNHLSTEGVQRRTERVIADLREQMAEEGKG